MRPIYTNGQKPHDSASLTTATVESAYNKSDARLRSFSQAKSMFESINEEDINNNNITSKRWIRKDSEDRYISPPTELNVKSVRTGIATFQTSSLIDESIASTSPELVNSNDSSVLFSNVDTTPLFSPSQILKLNRQRLARNSESEIQTDYKKRQPIPEYLQQQQQNTEKLNRLESENISKDLNNNINEEEDPKEIKQGMSKSEPVGSKEEPIKMVDEPDEQSSAKVINEKVSTTKTVFSYKQSAEKETKKQQENVVPSKVETRNDNRFSPSSSLSSSLLNKDAYVSESYSPQYKSNISPRHTVVSRRNNSDRCNYVTNYSSMNSSTLTFNDSPISLRPIGFQAAASLALKESRQKEKQQLGELNDRFAGYVERVRFLEAQNKKLTMELNNLKSKWGSETKQIEQMYKIELDEARSVLNDTAKTKDCVQMVVSKQECELENMRRKYNEVTSLMNKEKERMTYLQEQISANESEISLLRRRLQDLQDEEKRCKNEAVRMLNEIQRVSSELETEMKSRLMLENDKQSLEEELIFLKEIHAKEIEELKQMQFQNQGIDPAVFFKNELGNAIREIRDEYESLNQSQKAELEGWYRLKVSEIQRKNAQKALASNESMVSNEQTRKLKMQIQDYKRESAELKSRNSDLESRIREIEEEIRQESREGLNTISSKDKELQNLKSTLISITNDYEELMLSKTDLESEIRTYRKLLEGEEEKDGLKQIVEGIERRANNMTASSQQQGGKNLNRSYTVDTGYTSGVMNKSSLYCSNTSFDALNQTMPTRLYSNFAQKFEANYQRRLPNSLSRVSTTYKQFNVNTNPVLSSSNINNTSLPNIKNNSDSVILDNSVNTSNSSHYSSLFSR